ncbi:hypothetical protein V2J09_024121 [Rumex salicifolius]
MEATRMNELLSLADNNPTDVNPSPEENCGQDHTVQGVVSVCVNKSPTADVAMTEGAISLVLPVSEVGKRKLEHGRKTLAIQRTSPRKIKGVCWQFKQRSSRIKDLESELKRLQLGVSDGTTLQRARVVTFELNQLHKEEEAYWHLRSRVNELRVGDRITAYFHKRAYKRRSRNKIKGLFDEGGVWKTDASNVENIVVNYYQNLFSSAGVSHVQEVLGCIELKVNDDINAGMLHHPSLDEINIALF